MRVYWPVTYQLISFYCWKRNCGNMFIDLLPSNGHIRQIIDNNNNNNDNNKYYIYC
jgi:hypothetical protein